MNGTYHIVFYDGVCGLCNHFVRFILRRDRAGHFRFAPLQGALAVRELPPRGGQPEALDTIYVLAADGRLLRKSQAVLFVVAALGGVWRLAGVFGFVPRTIADVFYDLVARVRTRVFGRLDSCPVPSEQERGRFLDVVD